MNHRILRDPDWGYLRVDPIPSAEEVDRFYREEFYARARAGYINDSGQENLAEEAEYHRRAYDDLAALIEAHLGRIAGLRLADVGCGYGHFLHYMTGRGANGYGVEPVEEGVAYARGLGLAAHCLPIEALATPPEAERVDLVTMVNVLEHLREPATILADFARHWLVDGGHLLLRVPNDFNRWQTIADAAHGLKQWWVVPPQHINYFDRDALTTLLARTGFDIVEVTATFPLELFLLMGDVYVGDPVLGKACHRKRVAFERTLEAANATDLRRRWYRSLAELGLGREIIVLARRRG